jgi:hypothetical protein
MAKVKKIVNSLLDAIEFIQFAQSGKGAELTQYCMIANGAVTAFDGIIAAGVVLNEELFSCPNSAILVQALSRCGETFALSQVAANTLSVTSGEFQAFVPCCDPSKLLHVNPDPAVAPISEALTSALKIVAPLASDKAENVLKASVRLQAGSALASNGLVLLEAWHGLDLPTILIPRAAAIALTKCGKVPLKFGVSDSTATFWFEDNSWIRTQLYKEKWPESYYEFLGLPTSAVPIPEEFFATIKSIESFSEDGQVYCGNGYIRSHHISDNQSKGGRYGLPVSDVPARIYSIKALKQIAKIAKTFDPSPDNRTLIFGDGWRGAIAHRCYNEMELKAAVKRVTANGVPVNDVTDGSDIPF